MPRVLCLTGSVVDGCFIGRAVHRAAVAASANGVAVDEIDLRTLDLPLFDFPRAQTDGIPPAAADLARDIVRADALVLGVPEINGSMTGVLKNALDWTGRGASASDGPYAGLSACVVSGSKHLHAGLRAADHAKAVLAALGCVMLPSQGAMAFAQMHFDTGDDGELIDTRLADQLDAIGRAIAAAAHRGRMPGVGRPPWLDDLTPTWPAEG